MSDWLYEIERDAEMAVFLDGERIRIVQRASADTVEAPLLKSDGRPVFDRGRDNFAVVRRSGKVQLVPGLPRYDFTAPIDSVYPFHVAMARPGELSEGWDGPDDFRRACEAANG